MKRLILIFAGAFVAFSVGWQSAQATEPTTTLSQSSDAYFIVGVSPDFTQIRVGEGSMAEGAQFRPTKNWLGGMTKILFDAPKEGYLVGHTADQATAAVTLVKLLKDSKSGIGPMYELCASVNAVGRRNLFNALFHLQGVMGSSIAFALVPGSVTYITNVSYSLDKDNNLVAEYHSDIEGARAFLRAHYPDLADKLVEGTYQVVTAHC